MFRTLSLVSIALMALTLTSTTATAQNGERIARACVTAMHNTADKHSDAVQQTTRQAVRTIQALDSDGVRDRVIIAAGARGIKEVEAESRRASFRVADLREDCVQALRRLDAPQELIDRVNAAARAATESIGDSADRAEQVIRRAVAEAID